MHFATGIFAVHRDEYPIKYGEFLNVLRLIGNKPLEAT